MISASNKELEARFNQIITKGRKDNTYKFALARFLLEHCNRLDSRHIHEKVRTSQPEVVPYQDIADAFLSYYWHQECKYRIRQNYNDAKPPSVVTIIREVFGEKYIPEPFKQMDRYKIEMAQSEIRKRVFGSEKNKTSQVVPRFQNIKEGSSTRRMQVFYDYDDEKEQLRIFPQALMFFYENYSVLIKSVLLEWAKFLEKINTLPRLIAKIESAEVKRGALKKYIMIFKDFRSCFYCNTALDRTEVNVDHFIPWSYIFEDESWNLVLSCHRCNMRKNDSLAGTHFLDELILRNKKYQDRIEDLRRSLLRLGSDTWQKEITSQYRNCKLYGFSEVKLP